MDRKRFISKIFPTISQIETFNKHNIIAFKFVIKIVGFCPINDMYQSCNDTQASLITNYQTTVYAFFICHFQKLC